jgi:hypothetical protein
MRLTIDKVTRRLIDGLDKEKDFQLIKKLLLEYKIANKMSLVELDDLCWEDSNWVFDQIYN